MGPSWPSLLPCPRPHTMPAQLQHTGVTCAQALQCPVGHWGLCGHWVTTEGGRSLAVAVATALHVLSGAGG